MKQYLVMLDVNLQRELNVGSDYEFVANIHDEVQIQVKDEYAERVAEICKSCTPPQFLDQGQADNFLS